MRLALLLLMCSTLFASADVAKLSRFARQVAASATAVGVACSAMLCTVGVASAKDVPKYWQGYHWDASQYHVAQLKKLALTGYRGAQQHTAPGGGVELEFILRDSGGDLFEGHPDSASWGYLHTQAVHDGEDWHFPRLHVYLMYDYGVPYPMSYADGQAIKAEISQWGYSYYDFRAHRLANDETEGFVTHHLHLWSLGLLPMFRSSFGLGDLGVVETGSFAQSDLTAWAGDEADFHAVLWHHGSLEFRFRSFWGDLQFDIASDYPLLYYATSKEPPPPIDFGIKVEQLRSLFGDIDLPDAGDGGFTAIWEAVTADIVLTLFSGERREGSLSIALEGSVYRQRIDGEIDGGKSFSQNVRGRRITGKIITLWH